MVLRAKKTDIQRRPEAVIMEIFTSSVDKLVLIVDDDKEVMDLLEAIVRKEGFKTETAEDGVEAQAKARSLMPDLIILDLMLPRSGGFETLHSLQSGETSEIPVIVITGRKMDRTTTEMITRESNVKDFLEKPVKTEMLVSRIHLLLKTRPPNKL